MTSVPFQYFLNHFHTRISLHYSPGCHDIQVYARYTFARM